jgi:nitrogen-specific signal transduction histidine kinase/GAF domain-containing protein
MVVSLSRVKKVGLGAVLALLLPYAAAPAAGPPTPRRVLVLYAERKSLPSMELLDRGFQATLRARAAEPVEIYTEYLDLLRFQDNRLQQEQFAWYLRKYSGTHLDLIVCFGSRLLAPLLHCRDRPFTRVPILCATVGVRQLPAGAPNPRVTGILNPIDARGTLAAALRLQPETQRIVVVAGASGYERAWVEEARRDLHDYKSRLEFTYLVGQPKAELLRQVAVLPPHAVVLYLTFLRDGRGRLFASGDVLAELARVCNAPIYGISETYLGHGIVGGSVLSPQLLGARMGELALRVLAGAKPAAIPFARGAGALQFDARQLRRWGLPEERLPPGSTVLFPEPSFWARYRTQSAAATSLFALFAILAAMWHEASGRRRRPRRIRETLVPCRELVADLNAAVVDLPPDRVQGEIRSRLPVVARLLDVDRVELQQLGEEPRAFRTTHSWAVEGIGVGPLPIRADEFPRIFTEVAQGKVVAFSRPEAALDRRRKDFQSCRHAGVRSLAAIPLTLGGMTFGALVLTTHRAAREWPDELVLLLQLLTQVFAGALARGPAEIPPRGSRPPDRTVLAALSAPVALVDSEGAVLWLNDAWRRLAARSGAPLSSGVEEGTNYLELCRRVAALTKNGLEPLPDGLKAVLEARRTEFSCEYDCSTPAEERCHELLVETLQDDTAGLLVLHRDITQRKRLQAEAHQQLRQDADTARVTALGVMAASLAHELSQPLAAILSNSQAAQRFLSAEAPDFEEVRQILSAIGNSDRRAVEILRRLRSLIKREPAELRPLDLNELIHAVVDLAAGDARRRKANIVLELEPGLPRVFGDASQLHQVVLNLAMNGLEAMESGSDERRLAIRSRREEDGWVEVSVRDTGVGIPEEQLGQIFKAFHTTKSGGTGIGLWIARSFVEAHGGRIEAANNPEGSATFFFRLPPYEEETA